MIIMGDGRVYRCFLGLTQGYRGSKDHTIGDVRDNWAQVMDTTGFTIPASTFEYREASAETWSHSRTSETKTRRRPGPRLPRRRA